MTYPSLYLWTAYGQEKWDRVIPSRKVSELSRDWDVHPEIVGDINSKQVHGMCTVYVDDVFFTGDVKFMKWFEKKLTDRFKCKPANWNESKYLGMMLRATSDGAVELTSDGYERCIQEIAISPERAREMESFLIESEERDFRNMLGKAMWSARITRADCTYEVAAIAQAYNHGRKLMQ